MIIRTNNCGLPPTVVPTWITLVQLKSMRFIISRKEEGYTEWTQATVLSVGLFVIAHMLYETFEGDGFLVLIGVPCRTKTGLIDEDVGIGG